MIHGSLGKVIHSNLKLFENFNFEVIEGTRNAKLLDDFKLVEVATDDNDHLKTV